MAAHNSYVDTNDREFAITMTRDRSIVAAQLIGWSLLVILGDVKTVITTPYLFAVAGLGMLLWVVSTRQLGPSYSSSTRPRASHVLVSSGIYRHVRHPIYTGLLTVGFAFVLSRPTLLAVSLYFFVAFVTDFRARVEEKLLLDRYPEYSDYIGRTKRYVPFLV